MVPPAARLCALGVLLWAPGGAFNFGATNEPPTASYMCPLPSLAIVESPSLYYTWAVILSCAMLLSAALLSTGICVLSYYFVRLDINFVSDSQQEWIPLGETEPPAKTLETLELLESPPSPDVEPQQGEIQAPPPSPIVLVHRAQEDSSEDEAALVHRNIARRPMQPDSDKGKQ